MSPIQTLDCLWDGTTEIHEKVFQISASFQTSLLPPPSSLCLLIAFAAAGPPLPPPCSSGCLNLSTAGVWGQINSSLWDCLVDCSVARSLPDPYPLGSSGTPVPVRTTTVVARQCEVVSRGAERRVAPFGEPLALGLRLRLWQSLSELPDRFYPALASGS